MRFRDLFIHSRVWIQSQVYRLLSLCSFYNSTALIVLLLLFILKNNTFDDHTYFYYQWLIIIECLEYAWHFPNHFAHLLKSMFSSQLFAERSEMRPVGNGFVHADKMPSHIYVQHSWLPFLLPYLLYFSIPISVHFDQSFNRIYRGLLQKSLELFLCYQFLNPGRGR